jgi:hypothetical protein
MLRLLPSMTIHPCWLAQMPASKSSFGLDRMLFCEGGNHVNYGAPDSNRTDGSFGSITSFFPPRQLRVAAKLIFYLLPAETPRAPASLPACGVV